MHAFLASSLPLLPLVITFFRNNFLTQLCDLIYSRSNLYLNSYRIIVRKLRKTVTVAATRVKLAAADLATNYSDPLSVKSSCAAYTNPNIVQIYTTVQNHVF